MAKAKQGFVHGMTGTPTYHSWDSMKQRCDNPNEARYPRYGGRGITYDPLWDEFTEFFKDMGYRPEGHTLERIDLNGNYCKKNCCWATPKEQARNTSRNIYVEYQGEQVCLTDLTELTGIPKSTLIYRYRRGDRGEYLYRKPESKFKRGKLTLIQAKKIKKLILSGETAKSISKKFNVHESTIKSIKTGRLWASA